jgi:hypothetical protein
VLGASRAGQGRAGNEQGREPRRPRQGRARVGRAAGGLRCREQGHAPRAAHRGPRTWGIRGPRVREGRPRGRAGKGKGEGERGRWRGGSPWDPKSGDNRPPDHLGQGGGRKVEERERVRELFCGKPNEREGEGACMGGVGCQGRAGARRTRLGFARSGQVAGRNGSPQHT